jgi:CspA family cold shock protein
MATIAAGRNRTGSMTMYDEQLDQYLARQTPVAAPRRDGQDRHRQDRDRHDRKQPSATGTVVMFNAERGFGFLTPDDDGADVFVHASAAEHAGIGELRPGDRLRFDVGTNKRAKGVVAVNLMRA